MTRFLNSNDATKLRGGLVSAAALSVALLACSGGGSSDGQGGATNSGGAGNGNGNGTGQPTGSGGNNSGPSAGTFAGSGGGSMSNGTGVGGGCAGTSIQAEKLPLDMYIMLDQSGSMSDPVSGGGNKWTAVTTALKSFLQQPQAAGLGVGIQYFGVQVGNQDSCNAADYANPEVEIATLPGAANALITSIGMHGPLTLTPTSAALQGAVDHAKAWQIAHPTHVVVAVLATDGDPSECDTNLSHIDSIASTAANGTPKIRTFVIGVGSSLSNLNGIAAAGGTTQAFIVDTNQNTNTQFLAALNAIQGTALACSYLIPPPPMGQMPDFGNLNVEYTPGGGGPSELMPKVDNLAACPATGDAWYYDNPAAPTQIVLCKSACDKVKVDTMGSIHIVLGCQTILN